MSDYDGTNTAHLPNVEVAGDHGLTVDFARKHEAGCNCARCLECKGLRIRAGYRQAESADRPEVETMLLYASPKYSYVSSSIIRAGKVRQDISAYVLEDVRIAFANRT